MSIWTLRGGTIGSRFAYVYELNGKPAKLVFAPYMRADAIAHGITAPDALAYHLNELAKYARAYPDAHHTDGAIVSPKKPKLKWSNCFTPWDAFRREIEAMPELLRIDTFAPKTTKKTTATKPLQSTKQPEAIQEHRPKVLALPAQQKYVVVRVLNRSIIQELRRFSTATEAHDWCNQQPDEYLSENNYLDVYHIRTLARVLKQVA